MSSWTRQALGLPARRSEREKLATECWLANRETRRRAEAEYAEQQRLRKLPAEQAELVDRWRKLDRDPYTQRIRAEAAQLKARRRADRDAAIARARDERAAEERARETLIARYGWK